MLTFGKKILMLLAIHTYIYNDSTSNYSHMLHLSKGFGSYQHVEQKEISPAKTEISTESNTGKFITLNTATILGFHLIQIRTSHRRMFKF